MATPSLSADYRPLCDRHFSPMVTGSTFSGRSENQIHRCCAEPGCTRHYDAFTGYHDIVGTSCVQGKWDNPYACPEHEAKFYLLSHDTVGVAVWACPFCNRRQVAQTVSTLI